VNSSIRQLLTGTDTLTTNTIPPAATGTLDQFVERATHLYSLPAVAMEVLELAADLEVDADRLRRCIENDPALTAKVLRVVNSSIYGLNRKIIDLKQALAVLGVKPLKLLVLGFSLPNNLAGESEEASLQRYWRRTLTKAVACRYFAEAYFEISGDEAFIAGLLQDIGQLVLLKDLGESYAQFVETVHEEHARLIDMELETLGFDHAILSARLLQHWQLPDILVQAIAAPQETDKLAAMPNATAKLPRCLHLAELLCRILVDGCRLSPREFAAAGQEYCGITTDHLEEIGPELQDQVAELAEVISIDLAKSEDYAELLAAAHRDLADEAEVAASLYYKPETTIEPLLEATESLAKAAQQDDRVESSVARPTPVTGGAAEPVLCGTRDPNFVSLVNRAVSTARARRSSLSLLLLDVHDYHDLVLTLGVSGAAEVVWRIAQRADTLGPMVKKAQVGEAQLAVLLDCDRHEAVTVGRELIDYIQARCGDDRELELTISGGVGTVSIPAANFPASELVATAERCLSGARSFGGSCVKSLDVY
jgi:HD-like signal output (HDOD) protein/GGDEF domain-containing protein